MEKHSRKSLYILAVVAVLGIVVFCLSACMPAVKSVKAVGEMLGAPNLAKEARLWTGNGSTLPYTDSGYGNIDLYFNAAVTFNTVALSETGDKILEYDISVKVDDVWTKIYRQDFIRELRYSVFEEVTATAIKIRFYSDGSAFTVKDVGVYRVAQKQKNFRVVAHLPTDSFLSYEAFCASKGLQSLAAVTDIVLTGAGVIHEDGNITVSDDYFFAIKNVRKAEFALNKKFTLYCNFTNEDFDRSGLAKDEVDAKKSVIYTSAMQKNKAKLIAALNNFLVTSVTDGISFDWEFSSSNKARSAFASFLSGLKTAIGAGRKLSCAFSSQNSTLSKSGVDALDFIQIMAYDMPDATGNHASFPLVFSEVNQFLKQGYAQSKLILGIPLFARETIVNEARFTYEEEAQNLGRYYNDIINGFLRPDGTIYSEKRFYNGYLMVRDKTAYAYDSGLGGVMLDDLSCDCNYDTQVDGQNVSLLRAVAETLSWRKGAGVVF